MNSLQKQATLAAVVSCATIFAIVLTSWIGVGDIHAQLQLLLLGLALDELGRRTCQYGIDHGSRWEYVGISVQSLAWWVWFLNLEFLTHQFGLEFAYHLLVPAAIIAVVPALFYWAGKRLLRGCDDTPSNNAKP